MGWSSGTDLMNDMIFVAMRHITNNAVRRKFYIDTINAFQKRDWDCETESMGIDPVFDQALREKHPNWFDSSED